MKKKWIFKLLQVASSFALVLTMLNVNTTCVYTGHQPHVPDCAKRFKKQL